MDDTQTQTLSIPSLVAFAVVSFFAIRYFFFNPSSTTASSATHQHPLSSRLHTASILHKIVLDVPSFQLREHGVYGVNAVWREVASRVAML